MVSNGTGIEDKDEETDRHSNEETGHTPHSKPLLTIPGTITGLTSFENLFM